MGKTASETGWRVSRYNLFAPIPDSKNVAIANLFRGTCGAYSPLELFLLGELNTLDAEHPILTRFRERGLIVNFDERAALDAIGRMGCSVGGAGLTICPTMGCNFDCPYCFENHKAGKMTQKTQDDVVALAERMLDVSQKKALSVTWFGGEPLLAPDVIEALSVRLTALCEAKGAEYSAGIITNGYLLTQENADLLARCKVTSAQITLDGVGEAHDRTRHLAGGGSTFGRITDNLRQGKLDFRVTIRHNVHAENVGEIEALRAFVETLAAESGNNIIYYPAVVSGNDASDDRGCGVGLLCSSDASEISVRRDAKRFAPGRGQYCMAHRLMSVGIDEKGNLQKCWEDVDKPEHSFGTAERWDPKNPIATADRPDNLMRYINTALPNFDEECDKCVWLPTCSGGCPNKRLYYQKQCLPFRDEPEKYVLALYDRIGEEKTDDKK
ncbi:MAG: radical SAM protein [Oscillospiraceae bacterium]|nr:radical SAM protein [Oscillospiraceae bacterium]